MVHLPRPEGPTDDDFKPSRRALAGLMMFAGYALGAGPARAEIIKTDSVGLVEREVTIPSGGFELPAYLAMPENAKKRPVVIVVSEIFGVHEYIRDTARRLAKAGYVAIAPAFFARAGDPAPLTDPAEIRTIVATATNAQVMGDLKATIAWLETSPDLGLARKGLGKAKFADVKRVGVTGFCWGGAVTWMAAAEIPQVKAGVAWYGRLARPKAGAFLGDEDRPWPLDAVKQLHAPVLGLYAGQDGGIPLTDVEAMRAALRAAGKTDCEIVVYPDAQHGFHADYRQSYDQASAEDGWKRLVAWFGQRL